MSKTQIHYRLGVELWEIELPDGSGPGAWIVKDPRRTPEDWGFNNLPAAEAKFQELVAAAQGQAKS